MEKHIYPECMCLLFISLYRSWAIFLRNIISNFNVNNESASYFNIFLHNDTPPHNLDCTVQGTGPLLLFLPLPLYHYTISKEYMCLTPQSVTLLSVLPEKLSKYIHWAIDSSRSRSVLIQCSRTIHFWDEWTLVLEGGLCFNSISQPSLDIWKTSFMHIILARRSSTKVSFSRADSHSPEQRIFRRTVLCSAGMLWNYFWHAVNFRATCSSNWIWFRVPDFG